MVQFMDQEVEHVHSHTAVPHQFFSVGGIILEVTRNQQLEKSHGVYR